MAAKLRQVFRLFALYGKMDAQWFMQDTWMCLVCIVSETLCQLAALSGLMLLAVQFGGIGALNIDEVLFMLAFLEVQQGIFGLFFSNYNTGAISRRIGRGQLDHCLMQPIPLWMQLLTEGFIPFSGSQTLLCGIALLVVAMARLQLTLTPLWWALFVLFQLCATAIQLGMRYTVALSAFTHPVGSEEISSVMGNFLGSLACYPLGGLPQWLQGVLTTALPAGSLAWLPSMLLLGKAPFGGLSALYPLLAALIFSAGILSFKKGMTLYAKYGSQRYKNMGHRS